MAGGIGKHRLEPLARGPLLLAALLGLRTRGAKAVDELVAGALQLGDVDEPAGLGGGEGLVLSGGRGLGVGREAPLETGDLVAEGAAGRGLITPLDGGNDVRLDSRGIEGLKTRGLGVAAGVEDASKITRVDPGVAGCIRRRQGEILDRRR